MIEAFVRNPVKVAVGVILLALFGAIALFKMPLQLTPDVEVPTITIETRWPGASPQEVEKEIVQEQEEQLQSVEGLQKLTSESMDSMGRIILEFAVDADMNKALLMVSTRLQQVPDYPVDVREPVISSSNLSERFIAWFVLNTKPPEPEAVDAFIVDYPHLAEPLTKIKRTTNASLALLRLRELAKDHPEVEALYLEVPDDAAIDAFAAEHRSLAETLAQVKQEPNAGRRLVMLKDVAVKFPEAEPLVPREKDLTTYRRYCEDFIEARFERVEGVSNANVIGGREEEMQVVVEPDLLARSGLTIDQVRIALQAQNADVTGGDIWEGKSRKVVRTLGQFRSPEQIESVILARVEGRPICVRDIGKVRLGYKKPDGVVRRYGKPVIALNVQRETGANVIDVMNGLKEAVKELNETRLHKAGLQLVQVYDETEYIYSSLNLVSESVLQGAVLSFIVLLLFLKNIRSSLVIFTAIGTSMIGMFLVLGLLGRSLNLLSLAGISFAVGMLVDNFIVVLENIFRHRQTGDGIVPAVVKGTGEVWGAVIASTMANLAVFVPVLFVPDQVGQLFRDLALAVSCALALSLLVSLILVPTAAGRLLAARHVPGEEGEAYRGRIEKLFAPFDAFGFAFTRGIVRTNAAIQRSLGLRLLTIGGCLAFSLFFTWLLMPKVEYLPQGNRNLALGIMLPPPGYNLDQLNTIGEQIEDKLRKYWDVEPGQTRGPDGKPIIGDFFYVARGRQLFMGMRAEDHLQAADLVPLAREAGRDVPGMFLIAKQSSLFESGLGAGRTVDIEITGPDVKRLVATALKVMGQIQQVVPKAQVIPKPSADLSAPELHIVPRWDQAADMRVSAAELGYSVNALIDGAYAGDYNNNGDRIDLSIVGLEDRAKTANDIGALPIATPEGLVVTLNSVADVQLAGGPEQINRRERQRAITVSVTPTPETPIEEAMQNIQTQIVGPLMADPTFAAEYRINLSGTADKLQATWLSIRWNLLLAVVITYLVIAALFESWLYPFIIMLSVPLGAVGGFIGLWCLNTLLHYTSGGVQQLDMFTMVGFIILVGTVVNNPILIVEQALQNIREGGMTPRDAILDSVRTRIRPIFMTALIGLLGLLPLVISPGAGSELYRGLGSVTLGGLIFSTLFTLFFIPALFTLCMDAQIAVQGWLRRRPKPAPAAIAESPKRDSDDLPPDDDLPRPRQPVRAK